MPCLLTSPGHRLPYHRPSYFWVRCIIPWITVCNTDTIWMITYVWRVAYYIIINVPLWHFLSPGLRHHVISCGLISMPYISGNMHRVCSLSCLSYECLMSVLWVSYECRNVFRVASLVKQPSRHSCTQIFLNPFEISTTGEDFDMQIRAFDIF